MGQKSGLNRKEVITGNEYFKQLSILHIALVFGLILIAAVLIYVSGEVKGFSNPENKNLILLIAGLLVAAFFGGNYVFKSMMKAIKYDKDLIQKMNRARKAYITKLAFFEFAGLISILLFFIKSDWAFLAYAAIMILYMGINLPSRKALFNAMQLSNEEIRIIEDNQEPVATNNNV